MAYGDLRAIKYKEKFYCVPCACKMVEQDEISLNRHTLSHPERWTVAQCAEEVAPVNPTNPYSFERDGIDRSILLRMYTYHWLDIQDDLREGQLPDQRLLFENDCARCGRNIQQMTKEGNSHYYTEYTYAEDYLTELELRNFVGSIHARMIGLCRVDATDPRIEKLKGQLEQIGYEVTITQEKRITILKKGARS